MSIEEVEKRLSSLESEALKGIDSSTDMSQLEATRLEFLGQKAEINQILKTLPQLAKEERPRIGQLSNQLKNKIQEAHDRKKDQLYQSELDKKLVSERLDVTLPGIGPRLGHIHPLTQVAREIQQIFFGMGFTAVEGPEIETEFYNFDALNTPADHPARDEQDTFYLNTGHLLRSQTSTVQIRVMEKTKPPLRIISTGRVYRNEEVNARKFPVFHQVEGLLIDKDVRFGDLKGTLTEFIRLFFGKPLKTRFRPDFFPFTEPSAELDSECPFCTGKGCRTCGQRGWLEMLGCGMVDPNVLQAVNIDPDEWNGFAFGMGLERLAMLKLGIDDIRNFWLNDLRFLEQF